MRYGGIAFTGEPYAIFHDEENGRFRPNSKVDIEFILSSHD